MATSTKFIIRPQSGAKNSEYPIMLQIVIDRKNRLVSTKRYCKLENWLDAGQCVSKKQSNHKSINSILTAISADIDFLKLSAGRDNRILRFEELKNIVERYTAAQTQAVSFKILECFEEHEKDLKAQEKISYSGTFRYTKNNLSKFLNGKDIQFIDFDLKLLLEYEKYLNRTIPEMTSRSAYLRTFRTLWKKAIRDKKCPETHYPFKEFNFSPYNNPKTKKRAITKDQIEKIANLEIPPDKDTWVNSRNYFLFSYYCRGINFTDLAELKWTDIIDGELNYERDKTGEKFCFKLHPSALKILAYYKDLKDNSDAGYIFPILFKRHEGYKSIYYRKKKIIKLVNNDIKEIGLLVGIEKNLTTYVARHSYATALRRNGVSKEIIGQSMGHDSLKTTDIYLDEIGDPLVDDQINANI